MPAGKVEKLMEHGRRRLVGKVLVALTWAYATGFALYVLGMAIVQPIHWLGAPHGVQVLALLLGMAVLVLDVVWIVLFLRELLQEFLEAGQEPRGVGSIDKTMIVSQREE